MSSNLILLYSILDGYAWTFACGMKCEKANLTDGYSRLRALGKVVFSQERRPQAYVLHVYISYICF